MPVSPAAAPAASGSSTQPMSPDRGAAVKLVEDLYIAAKTLLEGRSVNLEEVQHEIRMLLGSSTSSSSHPSRSPGTPSPAAGAGTSSSAAAPASSPVPGATSPLEWKEFVTRLLLATHRLPSSIACLADSLKRELASAIRQGKQLCVGSKSAAAEASKLVDEAAQIYRTLSGPSYL